MRLLIVLAVLGGCDRTRDATPPPRPTMTRGDVPDPHTVDWENTSYPVGALGAVKATAGRAAFRVIEDDTGMHATQDPSASADWPGYLDVDPPMYVDLDHDAHDEAVIPFELKSEHADDTPHVYGAFVFTLRGGAPVPLGTITAATKDGFAVRGSTIVAPDGAVWAWDGAKRQLARR